MTGALAASALTTGCIVPEAPEYGAARQTPVFVEADSIFPNPFSVQHYQNVTGQPNIDFRLKVRAEDAGEPLIAVFYFDYRHKGGHYIDHKNYKPQTLDDERVVSWSVGLPDLSVGDGPECHSYTITVFHQNDSSWDSNTNSQIGTPPDMAVVTWFASFNDNGSPPAMVADCPNSSTETATP